MASALTESDIVAIADAVVEKLEARLIVRRRAKLGVNPGAKGGLAKAPGGRPGRPSKTDKDYLVSVVKTVSTRRPDGLAYRSVGEIRRSLGSNAGKIKVAARAAYDAKLIEPKWDFARNCQTWMITDAGSEWLKVNTSQST